MDGSNQQAGASGSGTWLLISYVWPEPQSSAAGLRDLNLIEGLRQAGNRVVVASAADNPRGREFCAGLEARGAGAAGEMIRCLPIRLNDSSFDAELAELAVTGVIYDRFVTEEQYGWRVRQALPSALQILDTQDLHFLRALREKTLGQGEFDPTLIIRELSSIHRVDLTWLISPFEKDLLESQYGVSAERLGLSRFAYPKRRSASGEFAARGDFCFVGNFRHSPNLDAFRWLRESLWPAIRSRLPHARLRIWGAYPTQEVMQAHAPARGFEVRGVAESLDEVFGTARVSLAPLRFGAGIKGKISDSWSHGVPVVSTPVGFEGMCDSLPVRGAGSSVEELADAAVLLHEDESAWQAAREWGRLQLQKFFSEEVFARELLDGITRARRNHAGRDRDWIRRMLTHHSLETPRFFGKWIELKESLQERK